MALHLNGRKHVNKVLRESKVALCNAPAFVMPDPCSHLKLSAIFSGFGLGTILLQEGRPIWFESKNMNAAERNTTATEQDY